MRVSYEVLRQLSPGPQRMSLPESVGRQLRVQIVPGRHEVDENVLVRANAEVVVEQAGGDLEHAAAQPAAA